jgi:hypothetical protein
MNRSEGAEGVGVSDYHWPGPGYSPVLKSRVAKSDSPEPCSRCGRDLRQIIPEQCEICVPAKSLSRSFQVQLPLLTLEIIKSKHKNVSAYLRGLIAKDLGPEVFPPEALNGPGGGKIKVKTET